MIHDSSYWKDSLAKHAEFINRKLRQRKWTDASFGRLEEAVILSCFTVRKLHEAAKIDPSHVSRLISLYRYPSTGKVATALNSYRVAELYDVERPEQVEKPFSYVLNQLIHSFVLLPVFSRPNTINGYAFNSDLSKGKEVYLVELATLAERFAAVGGSYLSSITICRVGPNGDLSIVPS